MSIKLVSTGGGSVTIQEPNTASDFTLSVPAATANILTSASNLTGLTGVGNLTEVDVWRLTSNYSNSGNNVITSNLSRATGRGSTYIGTGMSQSSGVFTFPSTGKWLITYNANTSATTDVYYSGGLIYSTTNNSTYNAVADCYNTIPSGGSTKYATSTCSFLFDVTDISLCKVRFTIDNHSTVTVRGDSLYNQTHMVFQKVSA